MSTKEEEIRDQQEAAMPIFPERPSEGVVNDAKRVVEKEAPKSQQEAKVLVDLSQSEAWKLLKTFLLNRDQRLLKLTSENNRTKGYNFTNSGFAFTIYDQITAADEALISYVEGPVKLKAFEKEEPDDADAIEKNYEQPEEAKPTQ